MTHETDSPPGRLTEPFAKARRELTGVESVLPSVHLRIAQTSIKPSRTIWMVAIAALMIIGLAIFAMSGRGPGAPEQRLATGQTSPSDALSIRVDDTEITAHLAAVLNGRAVLFVWSSAASPSNVTDTSQSDRGEKYRLVRLPPAKLANGVTVNCALYVADEDVHPVLEPPMVVANTIARRTICFTVSPSVVPRDQLPATLRTIGLTQFASADLNREIQRQLNDR